MKCPNCGNEDLQINEAWDKNIDIPTWYKIVFWAVVVVLCLISFALYKLVNATLSGIILVLTIIMAIGARNAYFIWRKKERRKTHSKCICPKCGTTWYID